MRPVAEILPHPSARKHCRRSGKLDRRNMPPGVVNLTAIREERQREAWRGRLKESGVTRTPELALLVAIYHALDFDQRKLVHGSLVAGLKRFGEDRALLVALDLIDRRG